MWLSLAPFQIARQDFPGCPFCAVCRLWCRLTQQFFATLTASPVTFRLPSICSQYCHSCAIASCAASSASSFDPKKSSATFSICNLNCWAICSNSERFIHIYYAKPSQILSWGCFFDDIWKKERFPEFPRPWFSGIKKGNLTDSLYVLKSGENRIRTCEPVLPATRFPGVPLQPLEHLSLRKRVQNYCFSLKYRNLQKYFIVF